ncbi:hypothetical protein [Bythopirellula polymerisocia]|uniref:PEP-CTERM protein-sorting domain-containing protein n=1 Tax=Bythopirellula polymerisocia TaxID=2528003 RepID=A0A5C6CVG9_9BACT|nr:hypothetical protein [Bythopirellula polymerisocia]TWU28448.1 hypothetical protein Pla144_17380 [Bythopirellula polymerisocia]
MNLTTGNDLTTTVDGDTNSQLNGKLAAYFAVGGAMATALSSQAQAAVVFNNTVQPFGINGNVNIDFNNDSQVDFQLDHDQVDLGGGNIVDYLQIDKNDVNGASLGENPLPINEFGTFPLNSTTMPNNTITAAYAIPGIQGDYPSALSQGTLIGPATAWDFQETANFASLGETIRANRLIDEDAGQVDMTLGGLTPAQIAVPTNGPNFLGLAGEVRYLGVRMDFASSGETNYGWIGIRIDNDADATGAVVGYGYETIPGMAIAAGTIPEPTTIITAAFGAAALIGGRLFGRIRRGRNK